MTVFSDQDGWQENVEHKIQINAKVKVLVFI